MKKKWYSILVVALVMSTTVTVQAIKVHVVPMAKKDGVWLALLELPSAKGEWHTFSADATSQPFKAAQKVIKENIENYDLPMDALTRQVSGDIYYFFNVTDKFWEAKKLNDILIFTHFRNALQNAAIAAAWASVKDIANGNVVDLESKPLPIEVNTAKDLQKYLPGIIKDLETISSAPSAKPMKEQKTLISALDKLTSSLTTLQTKLAS